MVRREFLRRGSLWVAAGLITPATFDRMDWARHRIFALGRRAPAAYLTLCDPSGKILTRVPLLRDPLKGGEHASYTPREFSIVASWSIEHESPRTRMDRGESLMPINLQSGDTLTISIPWRFDA